MLRIILVVVVLLAVVLVALRLLSRAGSATPAEGSMAPEFTLPSQDGTVSLKEYRGKWVVLYFYPKDKTPG